MGGVEHIWPVVKGCLFFLHTCFFLFYNISDAQLRPWSGGHRWILVSGGFERAGRGLSDWMALSSASLTIFGKSRRRCLEEPPTLGLKAQIQSVCVASQVLCPRGEDVSGSERVLAGPHNCRGLCERYGFRISSGFRGWLGVRVRGRGTFVYEALSCSLLSLIF